MASFAGLAGFNELKSERSGALADALQVALSLCLQSSETGTTIHPPREGIGLRMVPLIGGLCVDDARSGQMEHS